MSILSRRSILLGGFALVVAAPAIATVGVPASSPVAACMPGYVLQPTSGACVLGGSTNGPASIPGNPNVPAVDGIPCTGANSGQCIGLQESQGGAAAVP
jgi:hypothetical protein